jgi:hypothetical protein
MPLVEAGLVNLIPDPCNFDVHLRDQMLHMARSRSAGIRINPRKDARSELVMKQDLQRILMSLPRDALRSQLLKASAELDEVKLEEALRGIEQLKEHDPLAVLQEASLASGEKNGEVSLMKLAPNFEMAMYLAQATGSCIVTDHSFRWQEIRSAINRRVSWSESVLSTLAHNIGGSSFAFPQNVADIKALAADKAFATYPALMHDVFKYLLKLGDREPKPNLEGHLNARFAKAHGPAQAAIKKARIPAKQGRLSCVFPLGGIQDNTVNRLLLMSSSEWHLPSVPMAFFLAEQASRKAEQQGV